MAKKNGSLWPCNYYSGLNKTTVKYKYLLTLISEIFDGNRGAKVFAKLDLTEAYNLIHIHEGDNGNMAINTRDQHF